MNSHHFYKDLRNTKSSFGNRATQSARSGRSTSNNKVPVMINYEKREKLKNLLITKFMKKYHIKKWKSFDLEALYRNYGAREIKENYK